MVFAVAMTFIDQTIVAVSMPDIEADLHISATGAQWIINAYLLTLAALFAFGGKLGDIYGRRNMVTIGVIGFAISSAFCGFTPTGAVGQEWIILFRAVQGAFAAVLFPASVAIVVAAYPPQERGKAMAVFFAITGGLTAVGPIAGGLLTEWTWRAIFWVNIPVAIIALILIVRSKPDNVTRPQSINATSTALVCVSMGLVVLGLQQSAVWGWSNAATIGCIVAGALLAIFYCLRELRQENPLLDLHIFRDRGFAVDNVVLALMSVSFVPFFFFASIYAQAALGQTPSEAGLYLLYFFIGLATTSQIGGRILDKRGARPSVIAGAALSTVAFYLLANKLTTLSTGPQVIYVILAGGGIGLMIGPSSTDAVNRASHSSYSEVTGITQTARNLGASLGMAILGTILIAASRTNVTEALVEHGVGARAAARIADSISAGASGGGAPPGTPHEVIVAVQEAFAASTRTVFQVMAAVMAFTLLVTIVAQPSGRAGSVVAADDDDAAEESSSGSAAEPATA